MFQIFSNLPLSTFSSVSFLRHLGEDETLGGGTGGEISWLCSDLQI
jgi:hypothetical protein